MWEPDKLPNFLPAESLFEEELGLGMTFGWGVSSEPSLEKSLIGSKLGSSRSPLRRNVWPESYMSISWPAELKGRELMRIGMDAKLCDLKILPL